MRFGPPKLFFVFGYPPFLSHFAIFSIPFRGTLPRHSPIPRPGTVFLRECAALPHFGSTVGADILCILYIRHSIPNILCRSILFLALYLGRFWDFCAFFGLLKLGSSFVGPIVATFGALSKESKNFPQIGSNYGSE